MEAGSGWNRRSEKAARFGSPCPAAPRTRRLTMEHERPAIKILLVEDDDGHARLVERNLRKVNLANPIDRVHDGVEALEYLHNEGAFSDRSRYCRPHMVLLDINMPRMDGMEVLERIKADEHLRRLPVIMLTST